MIRLPQGTAITIFGIGSRPLTRYGFNNRKYTTNTPTDMITKDTFLVSFNIQGEGFCEPFLVTYRTEELNPYLRYPRQTLNPNHLHVYFTKQVIRELMEDRK